MFVLVNAACPCQCYMSISKLNVHVHVASPNPCCMFMSNAACMCCLSTLHVMSPCWLPVLHVHGMSAFLHVLLNVHVPGPCLYSACLSCLSMLLVLLLSMKHVHCQAVCPCIMPMSPCCMSFLHLPAACSCCTPMLRVHAAC